MEVVTKVAEAEVEMVVGLSGGPPIISMEAFLEGSREVVLDPHPNKTMDEVAWGARPMDGVAWGARPEMVTWAPEMEAAEASTMMVAAAGPGVIGLDSMT